MKEDRDTILGLLDDKKISDLIFTIFVYGSEKDKYFRQADLEDFFYSEEVSGNNTIRTNLKKIEDLFVIKNDDVKFHCYDGYKINDNKSYSIEWSNKKQSKGKAIIPTFKWMEILCGPRLSKSQENKLFSFYQSFSKEPSPINYSNYLGRIKDINFNNYNKTSNILQILKNELDINFLLELLGDSIFGKHLLLVRKSYINLKNKNPNLPIIDIYNLCEKYSINKHLLKKYHFLLIIHLMLESKPKLIYNDFYQSLAFNFAVIYDKNGNLFKSDKMLDIEGLIPALAMKTEFVYDK